MSYIYYNENIIRVVDTGCSDKPIYPLRVLPDGSKFTIAETNDAIPYVLSIGGLFLKRLRAPGESIHHPDLWIFQDDSAAISYRINNKRRFVREMWEVRSLPHCMQLELILDK